MNYHLENRKIYTIDDYQEKLGITILTGESDGTNMGRVLCDVNEKGKELLREFFGGHLILQMGTGVNDRQCGAAMLTHELIDDLMVYALLREHEVVIRVDRYKNEKLNMWFTSQLMGITNAAWNDIRESMFEIHGSEHLHVYMCYGNALNGMRFQHYFSGRVE